MGQYCSLGCRMLCLDKGIGLQWRHLQEASLSWLWEGGIVAVSKNCLEWGICGHPRGWDWGKAGALCAYQRVWTMSKALDHHSWLVSRGKTESAQSPCPYLGKWGRNLRSRAQGTQSRCYSQSKECSCRREPCYPRESCLDRLCCVQETVHPIGIPPVQILKISHFKN